MYSWGNEIQLFPEVLKFLPMTLHGLIHDDTTHLNVSGWKGFRELFKGQREKIIRRIL